MLTKSPPNVWYILLSALVENRGPFIVTPTPPSLHSMPFVTPTSTISFRNDSQTEGLIGHSKTPDGDPGCPSKNVWLLPLVLEQSEGEINEFFDFECRYVQIYKTVRHYKISRFYFFFKGSCCYYVNNMCTTSFF